MAAVELATAYYSLVPSMSGTAAAVRQQSGALTTAFTDIGNDAGGRLKTGVLAGVAGLGAGLVALGIGNLIGDSIRTGIDFGMGGIDIAGDISETQSAVAQVFGDTASASIDKWASQGAEVLGQTQLQALQAAQTFGVFGKAAGLAGSDLATFSTDLAGLGTDFASFYNTSPEDAITAIGAALRGESEPIRQYGVLLDEATLKAQALSMGIYDGNGSLTQQQRVLAAQAEIFAQSADVIGDYERTSGSAANQQKILASNLANVQAELGAHLLPAFTQLVAVANESLIPALHETVGIVGPILADALAEAAPKFGELFVAIAPMIPELVTLGTEVLPPILDLLIAISPLVIDWASNTAALTGFLSGLLDLLQGDTTFTEFADDVMGASGSITDIASEIGWFVGTAAGHFANFVTMVNTRISEAVGFVTSLPSRAHDAIGDLGHLLVDSGQSLIQGFIDGITSMIGGVGDAVGGVLDWAAGFFPHSPAERGPFSGSGWRDVYTGGQALMEQFAGGIHDEAIAPTLGFGVQAAAVAGISTAARAGVRSASAAPSTAFGRDPILYRLLAEIRDATAASSKVPMSAVQAALGSRNISNSALGVG
ncbi:hypothetical protein [Agromyces sp. NPDC058064]|uniref:hypothetical protein n=1 Tax=Agromyces sp. NPDC058064 TaxID=3346322 RepID=UPI0036DBE574